MKHVTYLIPRVILENLAPHACDTLRSKMSEGFPWKGLTGLDVVMKMSTVVPLDMLPVDAGVSVYSPHKSNETQIERHERISIINWCIRNMWCASTK